jgi:scyllo-inositol 2-dehydrogenase (NADP+)
MIRAGLVGLGKMGISHCAILNAHPEIELAAICDSSQYVLDVLGKYTGLVTYDNFQKMLDEAALDCLVVATPSRIHGEMVRTALDRNLHVFCEKPFCLDLDEGRELVSCAESKGLVTQVGYHYRFVETFREVKKLLDAGVLGKVHHVRAEAYGPVILRPSGLTWRTDKKTGGGCLYDYACHAVDLINYLVGPPAAVGGVVLNKVFSRDVDDEVYATLYFQDGTTGQIAANWSDESHRKMSTKICVWGSNGRIVADRQECQIYLRSRVERPLQLPQGWTIRYTTDLIDPVWYYLRGEEYSAQIDHFVRCIKGESVQNISPFSSAVETDRTVTAILNAAEQDEPYRVGNAGPMPSRGEAGLLGVLKWTFG